MPRLKVSQLRRILNYIPALGVVWKTHCEILTHSTHTKLHPYHYRYDPVTNGKQLHEYTVQYRTVFRVSGTLPAGNGHDCCPARAREHQLTRAGVSTLQRPRQQSDARWTLPEAKEALIAGAAVSQLSSLLRTQRLRNTLMLANNCGAISAMPTNVTGISAGAASSTLWYNQA